MKAVHELRGGLTVPGRRRARIAYVLCNSPASAKFSGASRRSPLPARSIMPQPAANSLRRTLLRRLAAPLSLLALMSGLIAYWLAWQYTQHVVLGVAESDLVAVAYVDMLNLESEPQQAA